MSLGGCALLQAFVDLYCRAVVRALVRMQLWNKNVEQPPQRGAGSGPDTSAGAQCSRSCSSSFAKIWGARHSQCSDSSAAEPNTGSAVEPL
eukprot:2718038-Rhodomonas_salina.1